MAALAAQHIERLVQAFGTHVVEGGRLHGRPPKSARNLEKTEPLDPRSAWLLPPAFRASPAKNWPIMTRAAPSSRRPCRRSRLRNGSGATCHHQLPEQA